MEPCEAANVYHAVSPDTPLCLTVGDEIEYRPFGLPKTKRRAFVVGMRCETIFVQGGSVFPRWNCPIGMIGANKSVVAETNSIHNIWVKRDRNATIWAESNTESDRYPPPEPHPTVGFDPWKEGPKHSAYQGTDPVYIRLCTLTKDNDGYKKHPNWAKLPTSLKGKSNMNGEIGETFLPNGHGEHPQLDMLPTSLQGKSNVRGDVGEAFLPSVGPHTCPLCGDHIDDLEVQIDWYHGRADEIPQQATSKHSEKKHAQRPLWFDAKPPVMAADSPMPLRCFLQRCLREADDVFPIKYGAVEDRDSLRENINRCFTMAVYIADHGRTLERYEGRFDKQAVRNCLMELKKEMIAYPFYLWMDDYRMSTFELYNTLRLFFRFGGLSWKPAFPPIQNVTIPELELRKKHKKQRANQTQS